MKSSLSSNTDKSHRIRTVSNNMCNYDQFDSGNLSGTSAFSLAKNTSQATQNVSSVYSNAISYNRIVQNQPQYIPSYQYNNDSNLMQKSNYEMSSNRYYAHNIIPNYSSSFQQQTSEKKTVDSSYPEEFYKQTNYEQMKKSQNTKLKIGLQNIGNTCYMNSAIQCLLNCGQLVEYFNKNNHLREYNSNNKGIAEEFGILVQKMCQNGKTSPERPFELKYKIEKQSSQFKGNGQQDAQELLRNLLEGLHDDLNRTKGKKPYKELEANPKKQSLQAISEEWFQYYKERDNSVITDLFTGQLLSTVTCLRCQNQSIAFDNFMDLSLSFSNSFRYNLEYDLERLIHQFLKEEQLDSMYYCSNCKEQTKSTRKFALWKLPSVLVLHIKRFHYGSIRKEKLTHNITFQVKDFDLSKFVTVSSDKSVKNCVYDLIGIVNHMGNLYGGHYYAECKNPYDESWNSFNDSIVKEIDIRSKRYETQGSCEPYLLFYCKKNAQLEKTYQK